MQVQSNYLQMLCQTHQKRSSSTGKLRLWEPPIKNIVLLHVFAVGINDHLSSSAAETN